MEHRITTVLLVDDHSLVRRAFRRMLEDAPDIRVVGEANDGPSAMVAAQRLRPDVVVMDFALPGMMGGEATQNVIDAVPTTTVLIVSMHSEPSYVRAALDAGASGYLLKSAVELDLAEAVRMRLHTRRSLRNGRRKWKPYSRRSPLRADHESSGASLENGDEGFLSHA